MKISRRSLFATIATLVILFAGIMFYTISVGKELLGNVKSTVQHEAAEKAGIIDAYYNYSLNSIKLVASFVSDHMTSEEIENPNELFALYKENTPFEFLMYIREDGTNTLNAIAGGQPFNARYREYYIEGMKGNTGACVIYKPVDSDQAIISYYSPLIYNDRIVGVLSGDVGGRSKVEKSLSETAYGHPVSYILCDPDMKVIASSSKDVPAGIDFKRYADDKFFSQIEEHVEDKDESVFEYEEEAGDGICCVVPLRSAGWNLIAIVHPKTLRRSLLTFTKGNYYLLAFVIIVLIVYFITRLYHLNKAVKKSEYEKYMETMIDSQSTQISILNSFSDIYYSAYLLDLQKDTFVEIKSQPELRAMLDSNLSLNEIFDKSVKFAIVPEYLDKVLAFTDISTIPIRLKDKKIISIECMSQRHGWLRVSFISVETDENMMPFKVLYVAQIIDDEKRREQTLMNSAYSDELTGLYNRRAYEDDLTKFKANSIPSDMVYVSFDVNGLKVVNDSLGHEAGDELICGAADCLTEVFGVYGKVYRTGGDEFQAIIYCNNLILDSIKQKFESIVQNWTGKLVSELRISAGYVVYSENSSLSVNEIVKLADQEMYKAKSVYYISKGVDRRGQQAAFDVLCQAYTKILKVDLLKDEYSIVQMLDNEKVSEKGFAPKISEWLENFAMTGQVHPEDVGKYLERTKIAYIQKHAEKNKVLSFQYRRKIDDQFCLVVMEIIPTKDYSDENQTVYLYVKNIEIQ